LGGPSIFEQLLRCGKVGPGTRAVLSFHDGRVANPEVLVRFIQSQYREALPRPQARIGSMHIPYL
jgi:hypothetical protein